MSDQGIDTSKPNTARLYYWWLGGRKWAFDADIALGEKLLDPQTGCPMLPDLARANRDFLARAVTWLTGKRGIRQFIDIGSGIPVTEGELPGCPAIHEAARAQQPDATVAYLDHDRMVVSITRDIVAGIPGVMALEGDLAHPEDILSSVRDLADLDPGRRIDCRQPIGVILGAVLQFVPVDTAGPVLARLMAPLAPGSAAVISVAQFDEAAAARFEAGYAPGGWHNYTGATVAGWLRDAGLTLALGGEPGDVRRWLRAVDSTPPATDVIAVGAVGLKPRPPAAVPM